MMIDAGGVGLLVGIATLGGLIWKMGAMTARFESTVKELSDDVSALQDMRKTLDQVPVLEQRVKTLEEIVRRVVQDVAELREKRAASEAVRHWSHSGDTG